MSAKSEKYLNALIPTPKTLERGEGDLTFRPTICAEYAPFASYAETFCTCMDKIFDGCVHFTLSEGGVVLRLDETLKAGTYVLDSCGETVVLTAADDEGMLYAIATLLNIVVLEDEKPTICRVHIEDAPDKEFRALMLDLAREWHPAHQVLHFIDVCFMMKIRYLHLHFIDNQRYTLPSHAYPDITKFNRSYTFEDIENFRAYANARGIVLIPEFEVPGHAAAMVKAYPEVFALHLQGSADGATFVTEEGVTVTAKDVICAGSEVCNEALRVMIREVCEMFPETPYIHIGGDEANIKAWNYCSECVKYMKEHNIADVYELYSEFTGRVAQMVLDCGKTPIVWEGFPKSGVHHIPKETIVIAWESHYHMVYDLLDAGFRVINSSWQPLYIVNGYRLRWNSEHIYNWDVYNWQHWWPKSEAKLNPIHVQPTDRVLGAQICSWQCTYEQEINCVLENLATLSERTWNVRRVCETETFTRRFSPYLQRIARLIQDV